MSLTVCLLTRNDERSLGRAVRSVLDVADQVVVADTGSTDRTVEIASELGAEVHAFAWDDDFAAGRNFALDQARNDGILWLNPDEELTPESLPVVRDWLADPTIFGLIVQIQELLREDSPDRFSVTTDLRLFRKHPKARYEGRLHPAFPPSLAGSLQREGRTVRPSTVTFRRHAYLSVLTELKLRWASRLLERELQDRPGRLDTLIEYGRTLLLRNDPKGHDLLAEAAGTVAAAREASNPPSPNTQVLLEYLLTAPAELIRGPLSQTDAMDLALRWFPNSPPLLWWLAERSFRNQEFRQAAVLLERLVLCGRTGEYDTSRGFDPSILGPNALLNLGNCYLRLGELDWAETCFRQLLDDAGTGPQAEKGLAVVQEHRRRTEKPAT